MRVAGVLAVPVRAGFFFDDQLAIRAGAGHDGFDYTGQPLIPGFRRVRQPGEAVSVLLVLDDGGVEAAQHAAVVQQLPSGEPVERAKAVGKHAHESLRRPRGGRGVDSVHRDRPQASGAGAVH